MISVIPGRRRAEEFAAAVERRDSLGDGDPHADLLAVVDAMHEVEAPAPRPEFVTTLRAQLMAEADEALTSVDAHLSLPAHPRTGRDRRLALAAGTLVLVAGTGSVAVASQGSLPGDTLYPVKRALEGAQTSITVGDGAKATRVLDNAGGRLEEIEQLAARLGKSPDAETIAVLPDTLDDFAAQANQAADLKVSEFEDGGDTKPIAQLREFTALGIDKLATLDSMLPPEALDAFRGAVRTLTDIDSRAAALCPGCGNGFELPASLQRTLQASTGATSRQAEPTLPTLTDIIGKTPTQSGNTHPVLPNVDPDTLGQAGDGDPTSGAPRPDRGDKGDKGKGNDSSPDSPKKKPRNPVKDLENTLDDTGDALLGDKGLLPVGPLLDPLLGPLLGKGGLLRP